VSSPFSQPGLSVAYIVVSVALWMLFAGIAQLLLARIIKTMGGSPLWRWSAAS